jgi:hypothetical protein
MVATLDTRFAAVRRGRARAAASAQAGATLIELLVASATAIVVFLAILALVESSTQVEARETEWTLVLEEDRAGVARMVRDIRQATAVEEAAGSAITFLATTAGKSWKIRYECAVSQAGTSYKECVRLAVEQGGSLPTSGPVVARYLADPAEVFSYAPSASAPTMATVKLELPANGGLRSSSGHGYSHNVVLEDSALMRNLYLSG